MDRRPTSLPFRPAQEPSKITKSNGFGGEARLPERSKTAGETPGPGRSTGWERRGAWERGWVGWGWSGARWGREWCLVDVLLVLSRENMRVTRNGKGWNVWWSGRCGSKMK